MAKRAVRVVRGNGGGGAARGAQERKPGTRYTKAQVTRFLRALARTCNVTRSAERAGMSLSGVYVLRDKDPQFRREWERALDEGYGRLELVMLQRALETFGTPDDDGDEDGSHPTGATPSPGDAAAPADPKKPVTVPGGPALSERAALAMLQQRQRRLGGTRDETAGAEDAGSIVRRRAALLTRLDAIRERMGAGDAGQS